MAKKSPLSRPVAKARNTPSSAPPAIDNGNAASNGKPKDRATITAT